MHNSSFIFYVSICSFLFAVCSVHTCLWMMIAAASRLLASICSFFARWSCWNYRTRRGELPQKA